MKSVYFENDDILQIRVSVKQSVREFRKTGTAEIVLLNAKKKGLLPLEYRKAA